MSIIMNVEEKLKLQNKKILTLSEYFNVISKEHLSPITAINSQIQKEFEPIRKVTGSYQKIFDYINFEIRKATGLVVDVEFGESIIQKSKTETISVQIVKDKSFYDIDRNVLRMPLRIRSENTVGETNFAQEQEYQIEARINDISFQKIIDRKFEEKIPHIQDRIIKLMQDKFEVKILSVIPSYDRAELIIEYSNGKVDKIDFSRSRVERALIEALYGFEGEDKEIGTKYDLLNKAEINSRIPNTITTQQIRDGVYRINKKVFSITHKTDYIKCISGREIQLNKDF